MCGSLPEYLPCYHNMNIALQVSIILFLLKMIDDDDDNADGDNYENDDEGENF